MFDRNTSFSYICETVFSNTGREWKQRLNSYKAIIIITAYVAIFAFLSLSFSRLILELRKNVVLAYFNQGVAQLFFLGLYIEEHQFFSWVLRGVCNKVLF